MNVVLAMYLATLLFSTTRSCKRHGIDPFRYLADVLRFFGNVWAVLLAGNKRLFFRD